ncbi:SphA family protein [Bordetella genomosp. 12]|uniref:Meta-pathway phenol degradation-like protein n=1 Tax=Bordetella genomosp. 12 TaxID=463035 RepID=A0A261VSU3_9BORD|nr:transporter [Bordetella genomosp. 12]OZI77099.1 meta-pathway phenol degradation-like protein [Bordetella genomosp. 12]
MKANVRITATLMALSSALAISNAQADGHYVPGVEGIQAASAPPPGMYYVGYLLNYDIEDFRAPGSSSNLPGHNTGTVTALANRFVWMTNQKFLGADYGMEAIVPVIRTSLTVNAAGISDSRSGVGDIYLGPLLLGWHGTQWDAVAAAGMWLDNGSTSHPASPGKGYKSTMLTAGMTYYFDTAKTYTASALMRYELNRSNSDGYRAGDQMTLEWGLGKSFGAVSAGLVGYSQWQMRDDRGSGATSDKASRHAIGAELVYPIASAGLVLKGAFYKEVSATAGSGALPKGSLARLTLVKAF